MVQEPRLLTLIAPLDGALAVRGALPEGYRCHAATPQDAEALAALYLSAYPREIVTDLDEAREEIALTIAGEYGTPDWGASPLIETVVGAAVATVLVVAEAPWPDTPAGPFVIEVNVSPSHRRLGLARYAIRWAAARLAAGGAQTMALRVMEDNRAARRLYAGLGFESWVGT